VTRPLDEIRREFWQAAQGAPGLEGLRTYMDTNAFVPMNADGTVILAFGIQQDGSSVFLRGTVNVGRDTAGPVLAPHAAALAKALSAPYEAEGDEGQGRYLRKRSKATFTLKSQWPEIRRWFGACRMRYAQEIDRVLKGGET